MSCVTYFLIKKKKFSTIPPLKKNIGPLIRIGREIQCLPYAGFFSSTSRPGLLNLLLLQELVKRAHRGEEIPELRNLQGESFSSRVEEPRECSQE